MITRTKLKEILARIVMAGTIDAAELTSTDAAAIGFAAGCSEHELCHEKKKDEGKHNLKRKTRSLWLVPWLLPGRSWQ